MKDRGYLGIGKNFRIRKERGEFHFDLKILWTPCTQEECEGRPEKP